MTAGEVRAGYIDTRLIDRVFNAAAAVFGAAGRG